MKWISAVGVLLFLGVFHYGAPIEASSTDYGFVCSGCPTCGVCSQDPGCAGPGNIAYRTSFCISIGCGGGTTRVDPSPDIPGICPAAVY